MKKLLLSLPFAMILFVSCDQQSPVTAPQHSNDIISVSPQDVTSDMKHGAIPGRFIVTLKPGNNPSAVAAEFGVQPDFEYTTVLTGFAGEISQAARSGLLRDNRVVRIEQDGVVTTASTTQNNATWGLDRIDQRSLPLNGNYVYTSEGTGVTAYIIDTGIRYTHNEFQGRANQNFYFDAFGGNGSDCNGHGTHVAGTVGGAVYGVAKDVNLVAVRVLDCNGSGTFSGVIAGMDWVASNAAGPSVANMSLGGGSSSAVNDAVGRMFDAGIPTIVAAGNGNIAGRAQDACNYSPAGAPKAYTVGATTSSDSKTSWSNFGNCVDIFAPGASITAAWHTSNSATNTISGTSMAAPHVAGVAALFLQNNSNASAQAVYDAITEISTKNIVTNSNTANNHLLFSLFDGSDNGGGSPDPDPEPEPDPEPDPEPGDNDPSIDTFNFNVRSSGPWRRAEVNWAVSDEDGDLSQVIIELLNGSSVLDSVTLNVSGSSASGNNELRSRTNPTDVKLTVTDSKGNTVTQIKPY